MSKYISKYVVCPFYRRNDTNRICCEGVSLGNTINVVFESKNDMLGYERFFCDNMDNHPKCLIYQMINSKYEKEVIS